jgi:UTP--glucose-1-phosphate uridylyltransferase
VLCGRYVFSEDTADLLNEYNYEKFGELQSIEVQKHWMETSGLIGVHLDGFQWYDSGTPLSWLKSQIDYALRRKDLSHDVRDWLKERLQR